MPMTTAELNAITDRIRSSRTITLEQLSALLDTADTDAVEYLHAQAREVAQSIYGIAVFMRGLVEVTNYCRNNCNYCGIRRDNAYADRYRLDDDTILDCCRTGYEHGMRTFVLQGGEDGQFGDARLVPLVARIRAEFPDCAITLSFGERSRDSYQRLFDTGANRYLLRHETADARHYAYLHPSEMSWEHRMECLRQLREIGYQVGAGFMVGSPGQTHATLLQDLRFVAEFRPEMCGIGPFIAAQHTPFADQPDGSVEQTLRLLSLLRLLHPHVLLPATTALGTLHPRGRELGILAGANVIMPNLSPTDYRPKYSIYDGKICLGDDVSHCRHCLEMRIHSVGYQLVVDRGDFR